MCSDKSREEARQDIYAWLMARSFNDVNSDLLARIYASWLVGDGVLPDWLGLGPESFRIMMAHHFPFYQIESVPNPGRNIDLSRAPETADLLQLLVAGRTHGNQSELWMAHILVAGCMGDDHLWQDLGLWSRQDLSRFMTHNFKPLAASNTKDMKWKKFLYKQLCSAAGVYVCRAPSCEVCADYADCYGSSS
jgi:nitrogen fixation protein NifQ